MSPTAQITTLAHALSLPTVVVPVIFDDGAAFIAESMPPTIGDHVITRVLAKEWCKQQGLTGDPGSIVVLRSLTNVNVAFVSLGSTYNALDNYRRAGAAAQRNSGGASVAFLLASDSIDDPRDVSQALVEGALLASYNFKEQPSDSVFAVVPLGMPLPSVDVHDAVSDGVHRGEIVAGGVNWAKRLIDSPPALMAPKELAKRVEKRLEDDAFVTVESWTESRIRDERLGGLLGVGAGSAQPTRLVFATYDPNPGADLPHIALVGKGVTFDSGGLSLKPPASQEAMKTDMTGAVIVMAALSIASRMNLAVRVTAIAPLTENLPSDRALMPGDVLTIRNGMTIEVLNTDAEGRLILADGLCLAVESNPDAIIDVATLTGAQRVALGDEVGAYFASTDELAVYFNHASAHSGEGLWRMPLVEEYESHIDSDVADMKNIGKAGNAGMISAALLLRRFTDGRPWVHLDIAGPGRSDSSRGYTTKGATAFSARAIVSFLDAVASNASSTV
jgi:leucyl aminopeptidase